jgi:hypothetical protein
MLNPLRFTKRPSLPRPEPTNALFTAAAGTVRHAQPPAKTAAENVGKLAQGAEIELGVVNAALGRLRPPMSAPATLQDRVREARHRLSNVHLVQRQDKLVAVRQKALALSTLLKANS